MLTKKRLNILAILIIVLPLIFYYIYNFNKEVQLNTNIHFYYVIISSMIALFVGIAAYFEYKKNKNEKIFYISIGFIGVAIFYTFHALVTPGITMFQFFKFPDQITNISIFVLLGDLSRLWLAIMMFIPENLFENNLKIKKHYNAYSLVILFIIISGLVYLALLNPSILPAFKNADFTDTYIAILTKVVTLLFLGINALKYYYSYKAKPNLTILAFIVGLCLVMETATIFMISKPWTATWWLAHNLFLLSYIVIGFGVLYSYFGKEKYEFFDVIGQINKNTKLLEEKNNKLNTLANYDALTGLPNRRNFIATTEEYIKIAKIENSTFALMFIDLDRFKTINDKYGHLTGDEFLIICSKKITSAIKTTDIASRIGGDEFVLLLKETDQKQIEIIAKRILEKLKEPITINGNLCVGGASIGVSIFPKDGSTVDDLISKSDEAMYNVKSQGRNNYKIFE